MTTPAWINWKGLRYHVAGGLIMVGFMILQLPLPVKAFLASLAAGLAHEQAQTTKEGQYWSDFLPEQGGPWNGLLDVAAFTAPSLVWILAWRIFS